MPAAEGISTGVNFFFNSTKAVENSQRLTGSMGGLDSAIKKVGAAAAAYLTFRGVVGAVRGVIQAGAGAEVQLTKLETSLGDSALAFAKYTKAIDVANRTPFETDQVITSVVKLSAYGVDAFEEVGKTGKDVFTAVGDMAGSMGKSIDDATEAIADALTGEMERMKQFGISVHTLPPEIKALERGSAKWREEIIKYIATVPRFAGGMEKMSKTLTGLISTFRGYVSAFVKGISGFADAAAGGAKATGVFYDDVKKTLESFMLWWKDSFEVISNLARTIGQGLRLIWAVFKGVATLIGKAISSILGSFEEWFIRLDKWGGESFKVLIFKVTVLTIAIEAFFERVAETISKHSDTILSALYAIATVISIRLIPSILRLSVALGKTFVKVGIFAAIVAGVDLIRNWDTLESGAKALRIAIIALGAALYIGRWIGWLKVLKAITSKKALLKMLSMIKNILPNLWELVKVVKVVTQVLGKALLVTLKKLAVTFFTTVIPAVWSFTASLLANPVFQIVAGIAALTAGIIALVKYWPEIKAFGGRLINWFKEAASGFGNWVSGLWDNIIAGVKNMVFKTINFFIEQYNKIAKILDLEKIKPIELVGAAGTPVETTPGISPEAERVLTRPTGGTTVTHKSSANITINEAGNARETAAYVVDFLDRRFAAGGAY